MVGLMNIFLQC